MKEKELADDYPVYYDYCYVLNGNTVVRSDVQGTVLNLKRDLESQGIKVLSISSCDIAGRLNKL